MKTSRTLPLVALALLAGCTSSSLVRSVLVPECSDEDRKPISRAAVCVSAAAYEISQEKKEDSR